MEWWKLEPDQKLVTDNSDNYCSADPGKEYVIYLRYGGKVNVNLSSSNAIDIFEVAWFNPRTGIGQTKETITGGAEKTFSAPDEYDWVLHLVKTK